MAAIGELLENTVPALGYELVDWDMSPRTRLVRVFIDKPKGVDVEDCSRVSHHLTHLFAVENVDFERLEVSSPGLDRPLRKGADFARFSGQRAEVRMRTPDATGRRRFVGVLRGENGGRVEIELDGQIVALELADVERAKLVPEL